MLLEYNPQITKVSFYVICGYELFYSTFYHKSTSRLLVGNRTGLFHAGGGFVRRRPSESIHWLTAEVHASGLTRRRPQPA
jgi:hypothetical protein